MATDYEALAAELKDVVAQLGVKKSDLEAIVAAGATSAKVTAAVTAVGRLVAALRARAGEVTITPQERDRKIEELRSQIELLRVIDATSPDFDRRLDAEREISRLTAQLGEWQSQDVLRLDQLLGEDQMPIAILLAQAATEIAARQDLARVLKGVEVALRAGGYVATVVAKLAIAAA